MERLHLLSDQAAELKWRRIAELAICPACLESAKPAGRTFCRACWALVAWPQRTALDARGPATSRWDAAYRRAIETILCERRQSRRGP